MIEKIILDYLEKKLPCHVCMEEEPDMPEEYVLIEKTGSSERNHAKRATLAIQSYSMSLYQTAELNEKVKVAMKESAKMDNISKCELNSDYNFTDTKRKSHRYQAVFDIVYF